jgi:hypothetical protein
MMLVIHMLSTCFPQGNRCYSHRYVSGAEVYDFSTMINPCTFARRVAPEI